MLRSYHGAVAWGRARESEVRLWVAGRRVKVVPPRLPSASILTRTRLREFASRISRTKNFICTLSKGLQLEVSSPIIGILFD